MLLSKNISPANCVYYNAAFVLKTLHNNRGQMTLPSLYCATRRAHAMSYPLFELCLDWLFLLGCVELNKQGIKTCF